MASPALESFCCLFGSNSSHHDPSKPDRIKHVAVLKKDLDAYNVLCIIVSSISIIGAIYQLLPRKKRKELISAREMESRLRQDSILSWLAVADLMASMGILVRASVWLAGKLPMNDIAARSVDFVHLFCAISSGWIQYFYICTYFWTFIYAVDIYRYLNEKPSHMKLYHAGGWLFSAVICAAGLIPLYYPSLGKCTDGDEYVIPHFLSTYLCILFVMMVNPILYYLSSRLVKEQLKRSGQFRVQERDILSSVRTKFMLIVLVFFVCWSPNVVNGIMMLIGKSNKIPKGLFVALWQYMAITNPAQGFLNSLVYRRCGGRNPSLPDCCKTSTQRNQRQVQNVRVRRARIEDSSEFSPLLSFRQ